MFNLVISFAELNSLFDPLIYAVGIRYFRVALIQFLSSKTFAQAVVLDRINLGRNLIGVVAYAE